jgi:hypothetical protein
MLEPALPIVSPVGTGRSKDVIRGLSAAAAGHILANHSWIPRNVFLQERHHSLHSQISRSSRIPALNDRDSFSPIKIGL